MPVFITQGRFTQEALRGMLAKPEDRGEAVAKLFAATGGKLLSYFMTFDDYDFLIVSEGPDEGVAVSSIIAEASGGVAELKTTLAISSNDMQNAFAKAGPIAAKFRTAGARA